MHLRRNCQTKSKVWEIPEEENEHQAYQGTNPLQSSIKDPVEDSQRVRSRGCCQAIFLRRTQKAVLHKDCIIDSHMSRIFLGSCIIQLFKHRGVYSWCHFKITVQDLGRVIAVSVSPYYLKYNTCFQKRPKEILKEVHYRLIYLSSLEIMLWQTCLHGSHFKTTERQNGIWKQIAQSSYHICLKSSSHPVKFLVTRTG